MKKLTTWLEGLMISLSMLMLKMKNEKIGRKNKIKNNLWCNQCKDKSVYNYIYIYSYTIRLIIGAHRPANDLNSNLAETGGKTQKWSMSHVV